MQEIVEGTDTGRALRVEAAESGEDGFSDETVDPLRDGALSEVAHDEVGAQDRDRIACWAAVRGIEGREDGAKEIQVGAAHHSLRLAILMERGLAVPAQLAPFGERLNLT